MLEVGTLPVAPFPEESKRTVTLKKLAALGKVPPGSPELCHPSASSVLLLTPPGSSPQPCSEQGTHLPLLAPERPAHAEVGGEDVSEPHEVADLREQSILSGP